MKPILLGQAPAKRGDPRKPLQGVPSARFLQELLGMSEEEYLRTFDRMNLLDKYPGKSGKGDKWPAKLAREVADMMSHDLVGDTVIMLGRNVANAFGIKQKWFEWRFDPTTWAHVAVIPHPSGVNRLWNNPKIRRKAKKFFKELLDEQST